MVRRSQAQNDPAISNDQTTLHSTGRTVDLTRMLRIHGDRRRFQPNPETALLTVIT
jgi:D-alanyl-D-alanine dipeptidase